MRFLIAGLGSIGRRHLRNLISLGERDIVLYRTYRSTLPDAELAQFPTETDLQTALERYRPDAVIVANPTAYHLAVALPAARFGAHILLEKPIAHDLQGVEELRRVVSQNRVRVLVGFQFRFHPTLRQVRTWVQRGEIGRVLFARAHWGEYLPDWHPWEDYRQSYAARADLGGGVVRTLSHPLDYLRFLFGDASLAWAYTAKLSDLELRDVEDTAELGLSFHSGVVASVHLDYYQRPPSHHLTVLGSEGTVKWDYTTGEAQLWRSSSSGWETVSLPRGWERNDMFIEEMRHFLAVARGESTPICTLDDGIAALKLALTALAPR